MTDLTDKELDAKIKQNLSTMSPEALLKLASFFGISIESSADANKSDDTSVSQVLKK